MADTQKIRIIHGDEAKAHLPDEKLILFTNRVNKIEVEETVGALRHEAAQRIFVELEQQGADDAKARSAATKIDPAFFPIIHMKKLRDRGDIAVAKDGEKTVGMVGFEQLRLPAADGRTIYELRRLGVEKENEKQSIGGQLQRSMFDRVRALDPQGLILVEAQHPAVVSICKKLGFKECTLDEGVRMKRGQAGDEEYRAYCERMGAVFLVYDPVDHAGKQ